MEEKKDPKQYRSPLWGISTSHLLDKNDFTSLLNYEPDVIEFYNYKDIDPIVEFCARHKIKPALHVPTPSNLPVLRRFCPTSSGTKEEIEQAITMTKTTIRCAAEISALHVVVHFPTPYPPYFQLTDEEIDYFFKPVCEYADLLKVSLLVENLTPHPHFYRPEHYLGLLEKYNIRLCLDVGHAHMLEPKLGAQDFIDAWGENIESVHLYNMATERYKKFGHEAIENGQSSNDGWIDIPKTLNDILQKNNPRAIILEYGAIDAENIKISAKKWLDFKQRELV